MEKAGSTEIDDTYAIPPDTFQFSLLSDSKLPVKTWTETRERHCNMQLDTDQTPKCVFVHLCIQWTTHLAVLEAFQPHEPKEPPT